MSPVPGAGGGAPISAREVSMLRRLTRPMVAGLLASTAFAPACKQPLHLGYDYGRAYVETLRLQGDITRASVATEDYLLYGPEGVKIRVNVQTSTSEAETGEATLKAK